MCIRDRYENVLRGAKEQLRAAQQANDPEKTQQASDAVLDAEAALNRARAAIAGTRAEIEKTNKQLATARSSWTQAGKDFEAFGKKVSSSGKLYESAGRALTTAISTPVLATVSYTHLKIIRTSSGDRKIPLVASHGTASWVCLLYTSNSNPTDAPGFLRTVLFISTRRA